MNDSISRTKALLDPEWGAEYIIHDQEKKENSIS